MKEKERLVRFTPYPFYVVVVITNDIVASRKKRNKILGRVFEEESPESLGGLFSKSSDLDYSFIFLNPNCSTNSLCHECYHATCWLFECLSAEHEEELFAYHLGYICEKASRTIRKYNRKK